MLAAIILTTLISSPSFADDPPAAVQVCTGCHDVDGNGLSDMFPKISALGDSYFRKEMDAFTRQTRNEDNSSMMFGVVPISAADMDVIVAYFAKQTPRIDPVADAGLAAKGKAIFQAGIPSRNVLACAACHGLNGDINGTVPRIAGQYISYQMAQFDAYTKKTRLDLDASMMARMIKDLTQDELSAVATYVNSLPLTPP